MSGKRQKNQMHLAFMAESRGEAPRADSQGTEPPAAGRKPKARQHRALMEEVCQRRIWGKRLKRVQANKGSPGVDGMTVEELPDYLESTGRHPGTAAERDLQPQPVKRVEIPKPDGGVRKLGIPTVLDRFLQQAVMQVLQGTGIRRSASTVTASGPGRSAHQAVAQAQIWPKASAGSWISTWRSSSTGSTTTS